MTHRLSHLPRSARAPGVIKPSVIAVILVMLLNACASSRTDTEHPEPGEFGVLVMAHGGSQEWNEGVLAAVEPLRGGQPVEVAFGMADATTIQQAVQRLESRGVRRVAVVRLFVSGESWLERTEQILGLQPGAPDRASPPPVPTRHHGHSMAFWRIDTRSAFAVSRAGLSEAAAMGPILADRAASLSRSPLNEDVLILAHGPAADDENERWLARLDERAQAVRDRLPFRRVEVKTLREDWPDKREAAQQEIRAFVERAASEDGAAIVIPFRVHGFGPYAQVLEGLEYRSDGQGLLPHPNVTEWVREQVELLRRTEFRVPESVAAAADLG